MDFRSPRVERDRRRTRDFRVTPGKRDKADPRELFNARFSPDFCTYSVTTNRIKQLRSRVSTTGMNL